jgi:hypothetical protein
MPLSKSSSLRFKNVGGSQAWGGKSTEYYASKEEFKDNTPFTLTDFSYEFLHIP